MADTKFVNNPAVSQDASTIGYTPTGTVSATNVQAAIDEVVSDLANTSDPANGAALVGYAGSTADAILKNSVGKVVASIAALKAIDNTQYTQAFVTGYYAAGDGGGGVYWYDSSDTTSSRTAERLLSPRTAGDGNSPVQPSAPRPSAPSRMAPPMTQPPSSAFVPTSPTMPSSTPIFRARTR